MDVAATTRAVRRLAKRAAKGDQLAAKARGYLQTLAGALHTQQRLSRAEVSADPSPLCLYCCQEEETQEHVMECPAWREELGELDMNRMEDQVEFFHRVLKIKT